MSALIIDTETTGIDAPEVIQLAYMGPVRRDESREIQNHLLNALVGMGELVRGEPL